MSLVQVTPLENVCLLFFYHKEGSTDPHGSLRGRELREGVNSGPTCNPHNTHIFGFQGYTQN